MFWRKHENIEGMLERYFDQCDECLEKFESAMAIFFDTGPKDAFREAVEDVHSAEGKADDLRHEIEFLLYGKALLPESRGDLLGLLEAYDGLPNVVETISFVFDCQALVLPEPLRADFRALADINIEAFRLARRAVDTLMANPRGTMHATKAVDIKESESDRGERALIRAIFGGDWDMGTKHGLKEAVLLLGEISDRAERVAHRIAITAIKRQV